MTISLLPYVVAFSRQLYFWRSKILIAWDSSEQPLYQSYYFDTRVTFSGQPFIESNYLLVSYFFRTVTFSQKLFVQLFWWRNLFRMKVSTEELVFGSMDFGTAFSFFRITILMYFFENRTFFKNRLIFQKSNIPYHLLFQKNCFFRVATFSIGLIFHNSYLFREATFPRHNSSEDVQKTSQLNLLSTATLLIYQLAIKWTQCQ